MLDNAFNSIKVSSLLFQINGSILGKYDSVLDVYSAYHRFQKYVKFSVLSLGNLITIHAQDDANGCCAISACPQNVQWFVDQQQLNACFGTAEHGRGRQHSCKVCECHPLATQPSALLKKRQSLAHKQLISRKRLCLR